MVTSISFSYPDEKFWGSYSELWHQSTHRSPFQSPTYIRFLADLYPNDLVIYQCMRGEQLIGATFFRRDNGTIDFLSEIKSDHNFFTLHSDCTQAELTGFFRGLMKAVKKNDLSLVLNYQPSWAGYMDTFISEGKKSGLFWEVSNHSVCPALDCETPEEVMQRFNKVKNLRYYVNRLKKQQSAVFEAFSDAEELDKWNEQFCDCHVKRWEDTPTPSKYSDPEMRRFQKGCLEAWAKEGLLCRFSVRVGEERIAFNMALRQGNDLVGHSQAYDPEFSKYSPGKAIMYFIGEWMLEQGISKIDFGKGGESYKYGMTNVDLPLYKIFVSGYGNVPFVLKSKLETTARANPKFIKIYRGKIKPRLQQAKQWAQTGVKRLF